MWGICVALLAYVALVVSQTTPTSLAFPDNGVKSVNIDDDTNTLDANMATDDNNNVLYVDRSDYDDLGASNQNNREVLRDPVTYDADRYANFGGFNSAELYRLLGLGSQTSEAEMSYRLGGILDRMSSKVQTPIDNIDHCPDRPEIGIQYYCMKLEDGLYFDPWNPWCGYIECIGGVAERVCCKQGTWLGPMVMHNILYKTNQKEMCRRPLSINIEGAKCPMPSTRDICRTAIKVEQMNPPKKKVQMPLNPFNQGELTHFSRMKSSLSSGRDSRSAIDGKDTF